jgi:peptidyl-tRNA hydrolase ICT1
VYPVKELLAILPKSLHAAVRSSRYHTTSNDSLTFHAQTSRSRTANLEENGKKLIEEITRIYHANTPAETSSDKKEKHKEM